MAIFALSVEANTIQLKIKLDKSAIDDLLVKEQETVKEVKDYIKENAIWVVNNQLVAFEFTAIKQEQEFYFLETVPINFETNITTIDLHNTCLIEEVANQSNVIYIQQAGKKMRGFNMNKKRTQISITL